MMKTKNQRDVRGVLVVTGFCVVIAKYKKKKKFTLVNYTSTQTA